MQVHRHVNLETLRDGRAPVSARTPRAAVVAAQLPTPHTHTYKSAGADYLHDRCPSDKRSPLYLLLN